MTDESRELAESVRSGKYFEQSRDWYRAIYLSPVSSRTMFLLVAILAGVVGLIAVMALSALLPLKTEYGVIIHAPERVDDQVARLIPLSEAGDDPAMGVLTFQINQFVVSCETWVADQADGNSKFVKAHASNAIYHDYVKRMSPMSSQSPAAALGKSGKRQVEITDTSVDNDADKGTARVRFTVYTEVDKQVEKTQWTAQLEYNYTALKVETETDAETKKEVYKFTDPTFQVVGYEAKQKR